MQLVNTVCQVTSDPPKVSVVINKNNYTNELINQSKVFTISVLDRSATMSFLRPFGFSSGKNLNKLSNVNFKLGITKAPIIMDYTLSFLEIEVIEKNDVGTHEIFIGSAINGKVIKKGVPLTYDYYHMVLKGKTSKKAPSYNSIV